MWIIKNNRSRRGIVSRNPAVLDFFDMRRIIFAVSCFLLVSGPQESRAQNPAAADWPQYARDYGSTGYSSLLEIRRDNVSNLRQICTYSLPEQSTFESSLVVVNGTM